MNLNISIPDQQIELAKLSHSLSEHGFSIAYVNPSYRGYTQHRYTLRNEAGEFVAWFCWYAEPGTRRPDGSRSHREQVSKLICKAHISPTDVRLIEDTIGTLTDLHPVKTHKKGRPR